MEITIDTAGVDRMLGGVSPRLSGLIVSTLQRVGLTLEGYIRREQLSGQKLQVRTGMGRRSIFHRVVTEAPNGATLVVGSDLTQARYMRAQEKGATITPKNSRFLTIPLDAAKTARRGVAKFTARELFDNPAAFGYRSAFIAKGVIFGSKAKGAIVPLFALKRSVTLKPVGYLADTASSQEPWIRAQFEDGIREFLTVTGGSPV